MQYPWADWLLCHAIAHPMASQPAEDENHQWHITSPGYVEKTACVTFDFVFAFLLAIGSSVCFMPVNHFGPNPGGRDGEVGGPRILKYGFVG